MKSLLLLTSAVVFVDTLFFAALTPLLPHYADALGLGKTGAGVLSAAYPAGALVGAVPSGLVAARLGVKPTVLVGMTSVAVCIALFGAADQAWQLDTARFLQGLASSFSWTGALAWLVAGTAAARRGTVIGQAFAAAVGGALLGPVLGGAASVLGIGWTFGAVAAASMGLVAWAARMPAEKPEVPQPVSMLVGAFADRRIRTGAWLVLLPALLFGTLAVLAPLRLSDLGYGSVAIGAVFLCAAAAEGINNIVVGRASDRRGPMHPLVLGCAGSAIVAALLAWPAQAIVVAVLVVCAGVAFGTFFTPAMTLLADLSEARGLDYGYTFALVSLAWAPGQSLGAAGGGALANVTSDAVPYLALAAICALTLGRLWPVRRADSVRS